MVDDDKPTGSSVAPGAVTEPADSNAHGLAPTARELTLEVLAGPVSLPAPGYQLGEVIGRGGMGEVLAATDTRIGREVAIKRMRTAHPDATAINRFLREARIQARLDHPAIVPVHELGTDEQGRPFFTMKRLAGVTLAERIADTTPQNRLLGAFVDVCNAVELAHSRSVVHRDLKPSNIMLGDYGEVYVIDWGVARVLTERVRMPSVVSDIDSLEEGTQTGTMLGTPGYMAPEQVKSEPVTTAADVYALGAILFEILVREPLHPRGTPALAHTLTEPQAMPSRRRTDVAIPPELDQACHDALAEDPSKRPTARQLAARIQDYLDGDRDVERRRSVAAEQLRAARAALADDRRALAVQLAGRALALDPSSIEAAELVTTLIVEPPDKLPAELVARLDAVEQGNTRQRITQAVLSYLSPFLLWAVIPFLHVKSWSWILAFYLTLATTAVISWWMGQRGRTNVAFLMLSNLVVTVLWSRLAGPLVLTPILLCGVLLALSSHPKLHPRPSLLLGWGAIAFAMPFALEAAGAIPRATSAIASGLVSTSSMFEIGPRELAMVIVANGVFVLVVGLYALHLGRMVSTAQTKLQIQAWHLNQLLPTRAQA